MTINVAMSTKRIKIFVSHSSAQKPYLEKLLGRIGHNYTIVDKYTFESAEKIWDEIRRNIEECGVFLFLASKEALTSEWVLKELGYVRELIDDDKIKFWPFIIDSELDIYHPYFKSWIRKEFITSKPISAAHLTILLERKIRRLIWDEFPKIKEEEQLFVGRGKDMDQIEEAFYRNTNITKLAISISGLPYTGRRTMARHFYSKIFGCHPTDLIELQVRDRDTLDDLTLYVNDILHPDDHDAMFNKLKDGQEAEDTLVCLLNECFDNKIGILLLDNGAIVRRDGNLAEWFRTLLKNEDLKPALHFNLASRYSLQSEISCTLKQVVQKKITGLEKESMGVLFSSYGKIHGLSLAENDIEYFKDYFSGYPAQAILAADMIEKDNLLKAKNKAHSLKEHFYVRAKEIIDGLTQEEKNLMALLYRFEFISLDFLNEICKREIVDTLDSLQRQSLVESFGSSRQYIAPHPGVADYMRRVSLKSIPEDEARLKELAKTTLNEAPKQLTDLSFRLYVIKENLKNPKVPVDEKYLMPSLVLKTVVEEYYNHNDDNVIALTDKVLNGFRVNRYSEVSYNLHTWLCMALARKKDERFKNEVVWFKANKYTYNFLYGFYWRMKRNFGKAIEYLTKAVSLKPQQNDEAYLSKAEHELTIAYMKNGDMEEALKWAIKNYNDNPENSYHIETYFRCLVRSRMPRRDDLERLIKEMRESYDSKREAIVLAMEAQLIYYQDNNYIKAVKKLKSAVEKVKGTHYNYPAIALREICQDNKDMQTFNSIVSDHVDDD